MEEEWKDIKGYEDSYQVSNFGKVCSKDRTIYPKSNNIGYCQTPYKHKGKLLISSKGNRGYKFVRLWKHNEENAVLVHVLVAKHFVAGFKPELEVNHKDGNKQNNMASNLEWVTHRENVRHAVKTGLFNSRRGERNSCAKLTNDDVRNIRQAKRNGISCKELFISYKDCGISYGGFKNMYYGCTWKHID